MPFKLSCPHCRRGLKVTEPAFGKTVPCPGCDQPISVPFPPPGLPDGSSLDGIGSGDVVASGGASESQGPPSLPKELPSLMPSAPSQPLPGPPQVPPLETAPASPPFSVPPLPGAGALDETESLLANYQSQVQSAGGGDMRSRLAAGANNAKKRARAIKLKREVNGLTEAMSSQFESLGTLAMTHKPPTVDMSGEIAELVQVQQQLMRQQGTLDSLRMGTGARSVVKQVEGEIEGLRNRQRELVIHIGRKVAAAKPDMPGTTGVYGALDRIQSSLLVAQTELSALERQIGPVRVENVVAGGLISKIACPSAFGLVLLLFFLPWLTISCNGTKMLSQSGLQTCYAGASSEQPSLSDSDQEKEKKSDNDIKGPSPAWLIILYALAIMAGLTLSVLMILKDNGQFWKWVVICSAAAFCLLTIQMIWGFPIENWLKNLPEEIAKQKKIAEKQREIERKAMSGRSYHDGMGGFDNPMDMAEQMGMDMMADAAKSKVIDVKYNFAFWLSWLLILAPAIVIGVEKGLAYGKGVRSP